MKKLLGLFFVTVAALSLASCGKKEYAVDGKFTAFKYDLNYGAPQITWVDVTVSKGKVTSYYIDAVQSKVTVGEDGKAVVAWNAKTKKQLKFDYNMAGTSPIGKEWFEQAEVIEAFFLENGPAALKLDDKGSITDLAGATVTGSTYKKLALEALENAKKGMTTSLKYDLNYGAPQITWVNVTANAKGKVESYYIDAVQSKVTVGEDGKAVVAWNAKTKKELKFDYNMAGTSPIGKEWFEQAEVIEAFFLENGPAALKLDDKGSITDLTGATVTGSTYKELALASLAKLGK